MLIGERVDWLNKNQSAVSVVNTPVNTFTYVAFFNLVYNFLRKLVLSPFYTAKVWWVVTEVGDMIIGLGIWGPDVSSPNFSYHKNVPTVWWL